MDFARDQRNPTKHMTGIGAVVVIHVIVVYALMSGLGTAIIDMVKPPFVAKIVEDIPPPKPEDIPPPPPTPTIKPTLMTPFIPPPDIQIALPQAPATTITTQAVTPTPPAPRGPVVEAPPAPRTSVRITAKIDKSKCTVPPYPAASLRLEEEGLTVLGILVGVDGRVTDSKLESSSGYDRLDSAAQAALSRCKFDPEMIDGKAVQSWQRLSYRWKMPT